MDDLTAAIETIAKDQTKGLTQLMKEVVTEEFKARDQRIADLERRTAKSFVFKVLRFEGIDVILTTIQSSGELNKRLDPDRPIAILYLPSETALDVSVVDYR